MIKKNPEIKKCYALEVTIDKWTIRQYLQLFRFLKSLLELRVKQNYFIHGNEQDNILNVPKIETNVRRRRRPSIAINFHGRSGALTVSFERNSCMILLLESFSNYFALPTSTQHTRLSRVVGNVAIYFSIVRIVLFSPFCNKQTRFGDSVKLKTELEVEQLKLAQ